MTYQPIDFQRQLILIGLKNRGYATLVPEMQAIAAALNADPTTHDLTIALPPAAVKPGPGQTAFTNEALLLVNRGKGGNLMNATMAGIINSVLGVIAPPVNTTAPLVTGTGTVGNMLINANPGTWSPAATSYTRQWLRGGAAIPGATANNYTLVVADSGSSVSCQITAYNAAGEGVAVSNAIGVTLLG